MTQAIVEGKDLIISEAEGQMKAYGIDIVELRIGGVSESQRNALSLPTPQKYIKKRPAKGGGEWPYVEGSYVKERLNLITNYMWDFSILSKAKEGDEIIVEGMLEITLPNGQKIRKTNIGSKEILYKRRPKKDPSGKPMVGDDGRAITEATTIPLSIGNDFKAAVTDCLKRCASDFGIASDVGRDEIRQDRINETNQKLALRKEAEKLRLLQGKKDIIKSKLSDKL